MLRRVGVQLVRATRANHTERYQKVLDDYFNQDHFKFKPHQQEANIKTLKELMPLVYLRNRPLISVHVVTWEQQRDLVTEIGFTIYDPENSEDLIFPSIKPHHILIGDRMKKTNHKYFGNHKKMFVGGESYRLSMPNATALMNQVLDKYLVIKHAVLVGHDIKHDLKLLQENDIDVSKDAPVIDTLKLHELSRTSGGSIRAICRNLEVPHPYIYNAANESYYTLLAAMKMCDPHFRLLKNLDIFMDKKLAPKTKKLPNQIQYGDDSFITPGTNINKIIPTIY